MKSEAMCDRDGQFMVGAQVRYQLSFTIGYRYSTKTATNPSTRAVHLQIFYRDNYNFFGVPTKMSGQFNFSLTLSNHRNFNYIIVNRKPIG